MAHEGMGFGAERQPAASAISRQLSVWGSVSTLVGDLARAVREKAHGVI